SKNSRKVVHGCIVATLKLYLPDGKEAKASPTTAVVPLSPETSISSQELYQLFTISPGSSSPRADSGKQIGHIAESSC
ncbi:sarcolemmal membrane-associated protein, partial [Caerostris extrusa]